MKISSGPEINLNKLQFRSNNTSVVAICLWFDWLVQFSVLESIALLKTFDRSIYVSEARTLTNPIVEPHGFISLPLFGVRAFPLHANTIMLRTCFSSGLMSMIRIKFA